MKTKFWAIFLIVATGAFFAGRLRSGSVDLKSLISDIKAHGKIDSLSSGCAGTTQLHSFSVNGTSDDFKELRSLISNHMKLNGFSAEIIGTAKGIGLFERIAYKRNNETVFVIISWDSCSSIITGAIGCSG